MSNNDSGKFIPTHVSLKLQLKQSRVVIEGIDRKCLDCTAQGRQGAIVFMISVVHSLHVY